MDLETFKKARDLKAQIWDYEERLAIVDKYGNLQYSIFIFFEKNSSVRVPEELARIVQSTCKEYFTKEIDSLKKEFEEL